MPKNKNANFAEVALALPMNKTFHYSVPCDLEESAEIGRRVWVEFGNRDKVGYIVDFVKSSDTKNVKPIKSIIDPSPVVSEKMLELCKWISDTYLCSLGQAINATIPGVLKKGKISVKPRTRQTDILSSEAIPASTPHSLNPEQKQAVDSVLLRIEKENFKAFLLHGITSSGKTEVYLQAIEKVLKVGKTSIVLVPEIALTPQTVERFTSRFGELVAVMHSGLVGSMRYGEWKRIKDGHAKIVVGARSAIFSPMENLGLVIIDEEHETSYKQDDVPRYHARDVALMRAKLSNCPVILGSATPSLESAYLAKTGKMELVELTKRIDDRMLPRVKIIDMRMELATRKKLTMFSLVLVDAIQKALDKKGQIIIFLNRRGFSTSVNCKKCGLVLRCKKCDSVLVYHYAEKMMICHYCNFRQLPPDICPKCKSGYMKYFGMGTEKVESEIARIFPTARVARMDTDVTASRGSHERILKSFKKHEVDILVGTQMIAKGLDFPKVTLVGVVNADVTLNLPDFRASERTFNLLTQVAGRAGRGEAGGEVILQTYTPEHYSICCAAGHDYEKFYNEEIETRKELFFPPFSHIIKLNLRSRNEKMAESATHRLKEILLKRQASVKTKSFEIVGPAPSPIAKVRGFYRWNLLLKGKNRSMMAQSLKKMLEGYRKPNGVFFAVDVDPMSL